MEDEDHNEEGKPEFTFDRFKLRYVIYYVIIPKLYIAHDWSIALDRSDWSKLIDRNIIMEIYYFQHRKV